MSDYAEQSHHSRTSTIKVTLVLCAVLLTIEIINLFTGRWLNGLGTIPRSVDHLPGMFFSPFLHGSTHHFISNITPFAVFTFLVLQHGIKRYVLVSLWLILATGVLVWLFGRSAIHVGMSGVVYGYFGYLVLAGFLSKEPKLILISLAVIVFYGGMIVGVVPEKAFVSWESHLFGFISGLAAAKMFTKSSAHSA